MEIWFVFILGYDNHIKIRMKLARYEYPQLNCHIKQMINSKEVTGIVEKIVYDYDSMVIEFIIQCKR